MIIKHKLKSVIDFGVGGGTELNGIIQGLKERNYHLDSAEANEVDDEFIRQAKRLFKQNKQEMIVHKATWLVLYAFYYSLDLG